MSEEDEVQEDASDDDRDEDKGEGEKIQKKTDLKWLKNG